jgi:GAF domain-containing protein
MRNEPGRLAELQRRLILDSSRETSFCESFFTTSDDVIIVEDTRIDARFKAHPLVIGDPFIRFYAAARLTIDGQTLGTLCAYDTRTREVSPAQIQTLQTLAKAAIELIQLRPASIAVQGC